MIKTRIVRTLSALVNHYYRTRNRAKPKLLIYTDSRGFNVISKRGKTPHESYIDKLQINYYVHYKICPEKYTTIVDFLNYIQNVDVNSFDAIIMHCGVVDFSPRPLSNITLFKNSKSTTLNFKELFESNTDYYQNPFDTLYNNEQTINIYSKQYLAETIIPRLKKIPNLIWINSNHFVPGWEGNYTKGRPSNIENIVDSFDREMAKHINNIIDLKKWTISEVKEYTIDNIHFTPAGFNQLYNLLHQQLEYNTWSNRSKHVSAIN